MALIATMYIVWGTVWFAVIVGACCHHEKYPIYGQRKQQRFPLSFSQFAEQINSSSQLIPKCATAVIMAREWREWRKKMCRQRPSGMCRSRHWNTRKLCDGRLSGYRHVLRCKYVYLPYIHETQNLLEVGIEVSLLHSSPIPLTGSWGTRRQANHIHVHISTTCTLMIDRVYLTQTILFTTPVL